MIKRNRGSIADFASSSSSSTDLGSGDSSEWAANLPSDVMFLILDKLFESTDHVRFGAVCKEWNSFLKGYYTHSTRRSRTLVPMLMIILKYQHEGALYSVSEEKTYHNFQFICTDHCRLTSHHHSGVGHGWLATVKMFDYSYPKREQTKFYITLLNPFHSEGASIALPEYSIQQQCHSYTKAKDICKLKVVLSADPTLNPNSYVAIVLCTDKSDSELAIITGGEESWTPVDSSWSFWYTDAIFYKGRGYAFRSSGGFELELESQVIKFDVAESSSDDSDPPCVVVNTYTSQYDHTSTGYLVESTKGDLLCVRRLSKLEVSLWRTESFRVCKLILDESGLVVGEVEVENIGDDAVFVGNNSKSVWVDASKHPGCQPNCIYYTNDVMCRDGQLGDENLFRTPLDMGVFNLENKTITQLSPQVSWDKFLRRPFWITPTFSGLPFISS